MKRQLYDTDPTDAEWEGIELLIPPAKSAGRPRKYDMREIVNAIFYVLRSGCAGRYLPHDFPKWAPVYHYFRKWRNEATAQRIPDALRKPVREAAGRHPEPRAGISE